MNEVHCTAEILPFKGGQGKQEKPKRPRGGLGLIFSLMNRFWNTTAKDVSHLERDVWTNLCLDSKKGVANTAQSTLAERLGTAQPHISKAIKGLVKRGLLVVLRQGGYRRGLSEYLIKATKEDVIEVKKVTGRSPKAPSDRQRKGSTLPPGLGPDDMSPKQWAKYNKLSPEEQW